MEPLETACGGNSQSRRWGSMCLSHTCTSPGDVGQVPREESPGAIRKAGVAGERNRCNQAPVSVDSWGCIMGHRHFTCCEACLLFFFPFSYLLFHVDTPCAMTLSWVTLLFFVAWSFLLLV
ncbi:hypothetical protein LZ32DRAFT_295377 [Colletotrichum eremochloae]|nr:hypothetical protein LZ32DRAFT_295377 [Colletotrichum eremochloae]